MKKFKVSVVIPSYNEEDNVKVLSEKLLKILSQYSDYELIFVNDGSSDNTLVNLQELCSANPIVKCISFSRNFGHQYALKAGLDHATGDCIISLDADMQHPPELIPKMINKWLEGYDIVITLRDDANKGSFFKKFTSKYFYKVINSLADIRIKNGAADFRLIDKKVLEVLSSLNEPQLFYRGLISWVGFKQFEIKYTPNERHSGKSKYSFTKMLVFAINGITSFSVKPLRISIFLGVIVSFLSFIYAAYTIIAKFILNYAVEGWTSILFSVLFLGGIQLITLGVIGEYLGKLFIGSKGRPLYIIKEKLNI